MDFQEEQELEQSYDDAMDIRCEPKKKQSLGFKNYLKMFLCRHPNLNKSLAQRKAKCAYEALTERTKQKYRDLGPGLRCCKKQKAQPAPPQCKKPRKAKKATRKPCCNNLNPEVSSNNGMSELCSKSSKTEVSGNNLAAELSCQNSASQISINQTSESSTTIMVKKLLDHLQSKLEK